LSSPSLTPSASSTETALPFLYIPASELQNSSALQTISSLLDLFKIVTTVKAERLDELLTTHPNRALVDSVCLGLREGVWPFANINLAVPEKFEGLQCTLNAEATQFTREQWDEEIRLDCYSQVFRPDLLPGMFSPPIAAVPKPHSDKL